jgi:hypothetical protein
MLPTHRILPELDSAVLANRFQPRLLNYRMKYYSQVKIWNRPQVAEFKPRMRDLALALAAPVLRNPQLEAQLFQDLTGQPRGENSPPWETRVGDGYCALSRVSSHRGHADGR